MQIITTVKQSKDKAAWIGLSVKKSKSPQEECEELWS